MWRSEGGAGILSRLTLVPGVSHLDFSARFPAERHVQKAAETETISG